MGNNMEENNTEYEVIAEIEKIADGYILMHEGLIGYFHVKKKLPAEYKEIINPLEFFEPALKKFINLYMPIEPLFPKVIN